MELIIPSSLSLWCAAVLARCEHGRPGSGRVDGAGGRDRQIEVKSLSGDCDGTVSASHTRFSFLFVPKTAKPETLSAAYLSHFGRVEGTFLY